MSHSDDESAILDSAPLGFPWPTVDPFLFCAYHNDDFPQGTEALGPDPALLAGRNIGMDFTVKDGFRMYHGDVIPGFPAHPHRGFETVTLVSRGYCDHSDSLGAAARFGAGDAQWLTAGRGIVHAEMFPLLNSEKENPLELFQIWLNLPSTHKMVDPHFSILWSQDIPQVLDQDDEGKAARVTLVAGHYQGEKAPTPPPSSWAHDPAHDVAIWTIALEEGRTWTLPRTEETSTRTLYFFEGTEVIVSGQQFTEPRVMLMRPDVEVEITAKRSDVRLLLLQGKPIGQPVAQHGPFVMNTRAEIQQAMADYQKTEFGGWPWEEQGPHHGAHQGRFAKKPDGTLEEFPRTDG
jgi:redox-sensitive bicupin YhaK (pirin superfamily)